MKVFSCKLILLLLIIELPLRGWSYIDPFWYKQAERRVQKYPVKFVFIGSSRAACSIIPTEFTQAVKSVNPKASALNMGRGYSTLAEHYFGLRRIAASMPNGLKGVIVFLEAPQGIPDLVTWRSNWVDPYDATLLVNTIAFSDLWLFLKSSNTSFDMKLNIFSALVSETINMRGQGKKLLSSVWKAVQRCRTDLQSDDAVVPLGGIRSDINGIKNARRLAVSLASDAIKNMQPFPRQMAEETVLKSLNELVTGSGGKLVLFRMPLSSVQERPHLTEIGCARRITAEEILKNFQIPMLMPVIQTTDDDFPDLIHLGNSRALEFTRGLAKSYVELVGDSSM